MRVYIAGRLHNEEAKSTLEEIDNLCKSLDLETFLPHRDVGIGKTIKDSKKIFNGDIIKGFKGVDLVVALLDGLHVGAGTAWELGYAYANKIPCIGLKQDESIEDAFESLSAILISSMPIVSSMQELKQELIKRLG